MSSSELPKVFLERDGRIATITVNAPPLNILDLEMLDLLGSTVGSLVSDSALGVVVVKGGGERSFSAGVSVQDHTLDKIERMLASFHGALNGLRDLDAVTVAAVRGHCLGGGMELALACDLVIATDDARFGQPEIDLGCYPPYAAALYPSMLGAGKTLDLLLTGRIFGCEEAERLGIVTRRAPKGELDTALGVLLASLDGKSTAVLRLLKKAVRAGRDRGFSASLPEAERIYIHELCKTEDMAEGLGAFLEKRPPIWRHR